jgi:hypothetical protein
MVREGESAVYSYESIDFKFLIEMYLIKKRLDLFSATFFLNIKLFYGVILQASNFPEMGCIMKSVPTISPSSPEKFPVI